MMIDLSGELTGGALHDRERSHLARTARRREREDERRWPPSNGTAMQHRPGANSSSSIAARVRGIDGSASSALVTRRRAT
jgi:hypothetical protein